MSPILWESQVITEQDVKFLKSIKVDGNWKNLNARFHEEKKRRTSRDWSDYLIWVSTLGIIAVCLVLVYEEYFA